MHYAVIIPGHIAFFDHYSEAFELAVSFGGQIYNLWGLQGRLTW